MYPGFILSLAWLAVATAFYFYQDHFIRVSSETFIMMFLGVLFFSIGAFCSTLRHEPCRKRRTVLPSSLPSDLAVKALFAVALLGLPAYIWKARTLAEEGPLSGRYFDLWYTNLRYAFSDPRVAESMGPVKYFLGLGFFCAATCLLVAIARRRRADLLLLLGAVATATVYVFMTTGRTAVFHLVLTLLFIGLVTRQFPVKLASLAAFLLLASTFVLFAVVLRKGADPNLSVYDNLTLLFENFLSYLLGSIPAFDQILHSTPATGGIMCLRFFYAVGKALGFNVYVPPLAGSYVFVPQPVNVYTFYQPYYEDFRWLGALVAQLAVGLWHGVLYRKATVSQPEAVHVFLYGLFMYPLLVQFFQDQYVNLLSTWLQYLALAFVFFRLLRPRSEKEVPLHGTFVAPLGAKSVRG